MLQIATARFGILSSSLARRTARALLLLGLAGCHTDDFDRLSGGAEPAVDSGPDFPDAGSEGEDAHAPPDDADDAGDAEPDAAQTLDRDAGLDATIPPADGGTMPPVQLDSGPDAGTEADTGARADAAVLDAQGAVDVGTPALITQTLVLASDDDDGLWRDSPSGVEELLHFSAAANNSAGYALEVGTDAEQCRTGLRFQLPLARGAQIQAATLTLMRVGTDSTADPASTMRVHVFDADSVAAFDHGHTHQTPAQHAPTGLWQAQSVGTFYVGGAYAKTTSKDLSLLLQHVIDRPGWTRNAYVGFVLSPDQMAPNSYAQFQDSFPRNNQPSLTLSYYE